MTTKDNGRTRNAHQTGWLKVNRFAEKGYGIVESDSEGREIFCHISSFVGFGNGSGETAIYNLEYRQRLSYRLKVDPKRGRITASDVRILPEISDPAGGVILLTPPEAAKQAKPRSGFGALVAQLR